MSDEKEREPFAIGSRVLVYLRGERRVGTVLDIFDDKYMIRFSGVAASPRWKEVPAEHVIGYAPVFDVTPTSR